MFVFFYLVGLVQVTDWKTYKSPKCVAKAQLTTESPLINSATSGLANHYSAVKNVISSNNCRRRVILKMLRDVNPTYIRQTVIKCLTDVYILPRDL